MHKTKARKLREYEKESFNARMTMERDAQNHIDARLKAVEILLKNQGRQ